jgi:hypothetical protein
MVEPRTSRRPAWHTSEVETATGAVESRQWIELAGALVAQDEQGAHELGRRYLDEIGSFTHGLVRSRRTAGGVVLVLAGAAPLLRFAASEAAVEGDRVECRFPIRGGLLAAQAGGSLVIAQSFSSAHVLELAVVGYFPRLGSRRRRSLRRALYSTIQARAHRAISRRFLERAAEGAGP